MIELLRFIGLDIKILKNKNILEIKNKEKKINTLAPYKLVKTMRAGVLVLGPLLTKYGSAKFHFQEAVRLVQDQSIYICLL